MNEREVWKGLDLLFTGERDGDSGGERRDWQRQTLGSAAGELSDAPFSLYREPTAHGAF